MPRSSKPFALVAVVLLMSGCASVGPNYHGAPPAAPEASARGAFLRAGDAVRDPPLAQWWTALDDPTLDAIMATALRTSPDITAARARIDQSRALVAATRAGQLPNASVSAVVPHLEYPNAILPGNTQGGRSSTTFYSTAFDASWEPDLFGGTRRQIESARAQAQADEASLADAEVALTAEIARAYVSLRAEQASGALLANQTEIDRALLARANERFAGGTIAAGPVEQARSTLAQSESDTAASRARVIEYSDQIAVLAGREPGAYADLAATPAPIPRVPAQVAIGDPALLLRNRPDIRIAERQLAGASADLGVRIADRFPSVSFTGLLGLGGANVGEAFNPAGLIALVLPQIKWNAFDGGRAAAQVRSAKGALAAADAHYRSTVLSALGDAETALTRFGNQRVVLAKAIESDQAAEHISRLQRDRAAGGTLASTDATTARRNAITTQIATITAEANLATDFVAVEKSLGLGWQPLDLQTASADAPSPHAHGTPPAQ